VPEEARINNFTISRHSPQKKNSEENPKKTSTDSVASPTGQNTRNGPTIEKKRYSREEINANDPKNSSKGTHWGYDVNSSISKRTLTKKNLRETTEEVQPGRLTVTKGKEGGESGGSRKGKVRAPGRIGHALASVGT